MWQLWKKEIGARIGFIHGRDKQINKDQTAFLDSQHRTSAHRICCFFRSSPLNIIFPHTFSKNKIQFIGWCVFLYFDIVKLFRLICWRYGRVFLIYQKQHKKTIHNLHTGHLSLDLRCLKTHTHKLSFSYALFSLLSKVFIFISDFFWFHIRTKCVMTRKKKH